jgi:hypothetical protein
MPTLVQNPNGSITISVTFELTGSLLEMENSILDAVNEVGCAGTEEALKQFDTNGMPLIREGIKWTSRNKDTKKYQTPFGPVTIKRHVYQTSKGGKIFCPLEDSARTVYSATPKFAQQLSHKYSQGNARAVCLDLKENHNRSIAKATVQNIANWVGSIARAQEEHWEYALPVIDEPITTLVFSLDGAYLLMANEGYREAMVGNISLYDSDGERQHTIYFGAAPEYGKGVFKKRYETEIKRLKARYPDALYLGIADGAKDNWTFLAPHVDRQLLDFYHVTEYLAKASHAVYPKKKDQIVRKQWLSDTCSQLKHESQAAQIIYDELKKLEVTQLPKKRQEELKATCTYFKNNRIDRMDYAANITENLPIGSGVTEAACKTLVKQRLCGSGMRWKKQGARIVLSLRALVQTTNQWQAFWDKINQFGVQFQTT